MFFKVTVGEGVIVVDELISGAVKENSGWVERGLVDWLFDDEEEFELLEVGEDVGLVVGVGVNEGMVVGVGAIVIVGVGVGNWTEPVWLSKLIK